MCLKKVLTVIIFILFYQTHLYSKSNSFNNFNPKNLSNYFSGIVAFENKKNSDALNFYNSSKNSCTLLTKYFKVVPNPGIKALTIVPFFKE